MKEKQLMKRISSSSIHLPFLVSLPLFFANRDRYSVSPFQSLPKNWMRLFNSFFFLQE